MAVVYSSNATTNLVTRAKYDNTTTAGSGRDLLTSGSTSSSNTGRSGHWGLSNLDPERWVLVAKGTEGITTQNWAGLIYATNQNSNFTFGKSGTSPDGYEFVEDFSRYERAGTATGANTSRRLSAGTAGQLSLNNVGSGSYSNASSVPSAYDQTLTSGQYFLVPLMEDQERDTLYAANHGLVTGKTISLDTTAGSTPQILEPATSTTSAPVFTTLADPQSLQVVRVTSNRVRLRQSNADRSIRTASGSYALEFSGENPTRNSLYIPRHGFSTGQTTVFQAGSGGTLPTLATTAPVPSRDGDIASSIFTATAAALDTIRVSMGGDVTSLYINGTTAALPFTSGLYTFDSGTYNFSYGLSSFVVQTADGDINTTVNLPSDSSWSQELPYDFMSNTAYAATGLNVVQSKYAYQQERDYWITVTEIPDSANLTGTNVKAYPQFTSSISNPAYARAQTNRNNNSGNYTSLTNGWRYTYDGVYYRPSTTSTAQHGFFRVSLIVDNSNYPGYTATYSNTIVNSNALHATTIGFGGTRYLIDILLPVKAGSDTANSRYGTTSGSVTSVANIASSIATSIRSELVAATYSGATTSALVKVINSDRLSLKSTSNIPFDFTNNGTSPLQVNLATAQGVLDGVHEISTSNNYSFEIETPYAVPSRSVAFSFSDVTSDGTRLRFYVEDHSLDFGQAVVLSDPSSLFTGLTDGTTYYAIPLDKDYFAIASTLDNALNKVYLNATVPTSGNFSFTLNTINGLIAAPGTVNIEDSSNIITGNGDTLFKQFFKSGDKVFIVDNNATPGQIKTVTIASVVSDSKMNLTEQASFTASSTNYLVRTSIYVRPDGAFLHRPFDGGVEITAGQSPNSSIVRQTRKYFRYQSGKGIQCSIAINFNPARLIQSIEANNTEVTVTTKYPHGLNINDVVIIRGSIDQDYNGTFTVTDATEFTFKYTVESAPASSIPGGTVEYVPTQWTNAAVRCGMFDEQNGFFYEYDGQDLYAVRRSSVQQLSGTVAVQNNSNVIVGTNTSFTGQLSVGDYVVVRGQSYKVTAIESPLGIHVQPSYRGISQNNIVMTKTIDTRVPQSQWNIDTADGSGPSNFNLDITKIQMVYMDYSWYGAGKIRFGFKDNKGRVKYMHEFIHNNQLNEAYMRSGNLPARYQIENTGIPSYVPTLFHWGTSVIMDGEFDDDKAYLFTAASQSLNYTGGAGGVTATTVGASSLVSYRTGFFSRDREYYVKIPFNTADASKFSTGIQLYSSTLTGQSVSFTDYADGNFNAYIFVAKSRSTPSSASYPSVASGTVVNIGSPAGQASDDLSLLKDVVPIVSIRLAPSVDNNLSGAIGERDIINRMQLQLKQLGLTTSHDCDIQLILNGSVSTIDYESVQAPSLSQLITHDKGDTIVGGVPIFSLRASGGVPDSTGKRLSNTVDFDLSQISDLGNAILGGDGVFPNGPDVLTIAAQIVDTAEVTSDAPFRIAGRLTWTESQA